MIVVEGPTGTAQMTEEVFDALSELARFFRTNWLVLK